MSEPLILANGEHSQNLSQYYVKVFSTLADNVLIVMLMEHYFDILTKGLLMLKNIDS